MNKLVLLLGSNVGDRFSNFETALRLIRVELGTIISQSSVYETQPWGNSNQESFLNQVIVVESTLEAEQAMELILSIEKKTGRTRTEKWGPRIIDIDILFFNDSIFSTKKLVIPHPELHKRKFTLIPLAEIEPSLLHPVLKKTVSDLLNELSDPLEVKKIPANFA